MNSEVNHAAKLFIVGLLNHCLPSYLVIHLPANFKHNDKQAVTISGSCKIRARM